MDSVIIVTFRGEKIEFSFGGDKLTVGDIRLAVVVKASSSSLEATDIKLIYGGKVLVDDHVDVREILLADGKAAARTTSTSYRIMALGVSKKESAGMDKALQKGIEKSKALVRDDLTREGQRKMEQRKRMGRQVLEKSDQACRRRHHDSAVSMYGFDTIETLPNLPDEGKAREILTTLANDPGVRACMTKHRWRVGSLAELYPDGKVGETDVCVMGLNKNKGQQILLRIRTDDLKGFRKILSIREVLYHELAHNVHSDHDGEFFQLMRQIKKECLEMDWTRGHGTSSAAFPGAQSEVGTSDINGGVYRLGGEAENQQWMSSRELARQAAIQRLMASQGGDEQRICNSASCTCGLQHSRQIDHKTERSGEHTNHDEDKMDEE